MKNKILTIKKINKKRGSVLLEALIGILLFSFAIIGLALIHSVTILNNAENNLRTEAAIYANELVGKMWASPSSLESFEAEDEDIPSSELNIPEAKKTVVIDGNQALIQISWKRPDSKERAFINIDTKITPDS